VGNSLSRGHILEQNARQSYERNASDHRAVESSGLMPSSALCTRGNVCVRTS
jgi:hypothetical protein